MFLETELSWVFIFTQVMINVSHSSVGEFASLSSPGIYWTSDALLQKPSQGGLLSNKEWNPARSTRQFESGF